MADADTSLESKMLSFVEGAVSKVQELEKRAAEAEQERDAISAERDQLREDVGTARDSLKKSASVSFDTDTLTDVCDLLAHSGLVEKSAAELKSEFAKSPTSILETFQSFLSSDSGSDGQTTTIKSASQENKKDLWREAAK